MQSRFAHIVKCYIVSMDPVNRAKWIYMWILSMYKWTPIYVHTYNINLGNFLNTLKRNTGNVEYSQEWCRILYQLSDGQGVWSNAKWNSLQQEHNACL